MADSRKGGFHITESLTSKIYISSDKDEIQLLNQSYFMFYFLTGPAINSDEAKQYFAISQINSALKWGKNGPEKIKPMEELKDIVILKIRL